MTAVPRTRGCRTLLAAATLAGLLPMTGCWPAATQPGSTTRTPAAAQAERLPAPPPQIRRSAAQLAQGLLTLAEVPAGMAVLPGVQQSPGDSGAVVGRRPCRTLVRLLDSGRRPGSSATARITFSGGQDGVLLDETLDAMGSGVAAKRVVDTYAAAVHGCREVTLHTPGKRRSGLRARAVPWGDQGDDRFAVRFTGRSGPLKGFSALLVLARAGDVVVALTCLGTSDTAAAARAEDAVGKVQHTNARRPA